MTFTFNHMESSEEFTLPAKNEGLMSTDSLTSIHAEEMTHTHILNKAVPEDELKL